MEPSRWDPLIERPTTSPRERRRARLIWLVIFLVAGVLAVLTARRDPAPVLAPRTVEVPVEIIITAPDDAPTPAPASAPTSAPSTAP